jgi:hypothetical protein
MLRWSPYATNDTTVTSSADVITITNLTLGPALHPFAVETWTLSLLPPSVMSDETLTLDVERQWLREVMVVVAMMLLLLLLLLLPLPLLLLLLLLLMMMTMTTCLLNPNVDNHHVCSRLLCSVTV